MTKLLAGAEYFKIEYVQQRCFEFLEKNEIVLENSLDILKTVSRIDKPTLRNKIKNYISINLNEVSNIKKFKGLPKKDLISCISIVIVRVLAKGQSTKLWLQGPP